MTQGVLAVTRGGRVVMKIIVGCGGYNVEKVAQGLEKSFAPSVEQAQLLCEQSSFGCRDCRVIQVEMPGGEPEVHTESREFLMLADLYRNSFPLPEFNPRWERGDGAVTRVIRYA